MEIREIERNELKPLLELYTQLHDNGMPMIDENLERLWNSIISDKNHHIIGKFVGGRLVSSCVLVIVPNLTHNQRPYALIENVITHEACRNRGYASELLRFAKNMAANENCYKIMLMTGSKNENVLRFYEKAGYNRHDKTAFIQWL